MKGEDIVSLALALFLLTVVGYNLLVEYSEYQEAMLKDRLTICEKVLAIENHFSNKIDESLEAIESLRPAKVKECAQFSEDCVPGYIMDIEEAE